MDTASLGKDERSLFVSRLIRERDLRYLETLITVRACVTGGLIAAGRDPGKGLDDLLRDYRNVLFPEDEADLIDIAKKHEDMLKEEFSKGPLKVKSLSQSKKGRKK